MKFPLIFLALIILIANASAVTVMNPRFNETVVAGDTALYHFSAKPDTEGTVTFSTITTEGDCREWVHVSQIPPLTFNDSIPLDATITVPKTATNGMHSCQITFTAPPSGMLQYAIGLAVHVNVINGTEPTPTPTIVTTTSPTQTASETTAHTTYAPVSVVTVIGSIGALLMIRRRP